MKNGLIIDIYGNKYWYKEGQLHREDGPACEYANETKYWYKDGRCHREGGPAIEYADGTKYWYINGKPLNCNTQEEFLKLIKMKAFW